MSIVYAILMVHTTHIIPLYACCHDHRIVQVAYFAEGGGKFVMEFVDIPDWIGLPGSFWGAGALMLISLSYTLLIESFIIHALILLMVKYP